MLPRIPAAIPAMREITVVIIVSSSITMPICVFQTENIVKSDFFLSSFHQETVAVDQKDHTEDNNNDFSGGKYHADFGSMADGLIKCRAVTKEFHHIDHGDAEDAGDHVRNVGTFIVADILDGQF